MVADIAAEVSSYKMQSDLTLFTVRLRLSQMLNPNCFRSAEGLAPRERLSLDNRSSRQGGWNRSGLEKGRFTSASTPQSRSSMRPRNVIVPDNVGKALAR